MPEYPYASGETPMIGDRIRYHLTEYVVTQSQVPEWPNFVHAKLPCGCDTRRLIAESCTLVGRDRSRLIRKSVEAVAAAIKVIREKQIRAKIATSAQNAIVLVDKIKKSLLPFPKICRSIFARGYTLIYIHVRGRARV